MLLHTLILTRYKFQRVNSDAPRSMLGSAPDTCLRAPEEYAQVWALYFEKWIEAYANQSISIWGVTVQNEPELQI